MSHEADRKIDMSVSRSKLVALITSPLSGLSVHRAVYMVPCAETIDVLEATETSAASWLRSNWKPHGVPQQGSPRRANANIRDIYRSVIVPESLRIIGTVNGTVNFLLDCLMGTIRFKMRLSLIARRFAKLIRRDDKRKKSSDYSL